MIRSKHDAIPDSESRFSERSFRRFEPDLIEVCKHYPKPVQIHPRSVHIETYRARVKDSMRAFVNSSWDSLVDKNKINFILHNCAITIRQGNLIIGPLGCELQSPNSVVNSIDQRESLAIQVSVTNTQEFSAVLVLAEAGKLPLEVEILDITPEQIKQLEISRPGVRIGERDGKFYLI